MKTILIVDDRLELTKLYRLYLESLGGYKVFPENRASRAVEVVVKCRPDLIAMVLLMPDMLGCDVAAALREAPVMAHIKVIFVTAMLRQDQVEKANEPMRGSRIIAKPINASDLITAIEKEFV